MGLRVLRVAHSWCGRTMGSLAHRTSPTVTVAIQAAVDATEVFSTRNKGAHAMIHNPGNSACREIHAGAIEIDCPSEYLG